MSRSGVASTLIGARTLEPLAPNLAATGVSLNHETSAALDALSMPVQSLPINMLKTRIDLSLGGASLNGVSSKPFKAG